MPREIGRGVKLGSVYVVVIWVNFKTLSYFLSVLPTTAEAN